MEELSSLEQANVDLDIALSEVYETWFECDLQVDPNLEQVFFTLLRMAFLTGRKVGRADMVEIGECHLQDVRALLARLGY